MTEIARLLSMSEAETFALVRLGIKDHEIQTIKEDSPGDSQRVIRKILNKWRKKSPRNTAEVNSTSHS